MSDTLIDIHTGPLPETVFLKEEQKNENNPYYGVLSKGQTDYLKYRMLRTSTEKYITIKELAKFKESLPQNEFKKELSDHVLDKNLAEKLFIADFIEKGYIFPEKVSQDLYFRFNFETGELAHLGEENGSRVEFLIWWAYYFTLQIKKLKEQWVNMWYIKVSIKKNPTDNEFYIESIDAVAEKDS